MVAFKRLKPIQPSDHTLLREIYLDSIEGSAHIFYSKEQIQAWSSLAFLSGVLDKSFSEGQGWKSLESNEVVAFAIRYPMERLALLYCRSAFTRRGHATALINQTELDALQEGLISLRTEASFFSYPLLIRLGWTLLFVQKINIGGVLFSRYIMEKTLVSLAVD